MSITNLRLADGSFITGCGLKATLDVEANHVLIENKQGATATYYYAIDTAVLDGSRGEYLLSENELKWLNSQSVKRWIDFAYDSMVHN